MNSDAIKQTLWLVHRARSIQDERIKMIVNVIEEISKIMHSSISHKGRR